jgi:hypothetical protein
VAKRIPRRTRQKRVPTEERPIQDASKRVATMHRLQGLVPSKVKQAVLEPVFLWKLEENSRAGASKNPVDGVGLSVKFRARLAGLEQRAQCF